MDRLQTMMTFVRVVQADSFSAAGAQLGVSRALVSRHIADLEAHVGVRLLNRTTRSVGVTEAGRRYFEVCEQVLASLRDIDEAVQHLNGDMEGHLSVLSPKWIGYLDVNTAIIDFCRLYPKLHVHVALGGVSSRTHDFLAKGHDVVFHTRPIRDSMVKVKKVAEIAFALVASADYLAARGLPATAHDLREHDCLVQTTDPVWHIGEGAEEMRFKPVPRLSANSFGTLQQGAEAGLGIALMPVRVVREGLVSGRLQQILPGCYIANRPLYAGFAPGGNLPRKVRALVDFMSDWFRRHPLT